MQINSQSGSEPGDTVIIAYFHFGFFDLFLDRSCCLLPDLSVSLQEHLGTHILAEAARNEKEAETVFLFSRSSWLTEITDLKRMNLT